MEYTTRTAKKDQEIMTAKWHKDCANWKPGLYGSAEGFPQLSMYGFHRSYGYVTRGERGACWRKTKAESIEAFKKMYGLGYVWKTRIFKKKETFQKWVEKQSHKYQWQEIFVNNAYGVEYRKLRKVY